MYTLNRRAILQSIVIAIIVLVGTVGLRGIPAYALGLTPPEVTINSILRNTTQYKTVTIVRGAEERGDLTIRVQPRQDSTEYFDIEEYEEFIMPESANSMNYDIPVAPGDTPNGTYEAKIDFLKIPDASSVEGDDGAVAVGMVLITGVTARINFTIGGEEIVDFSLANLSIGDTEVDTSVFINYLARNTGNVSWRPDYIELEFIDIDNPNNTIIERVEGETIDPVSPGVDEQKMQLEVPHTLDTGTYTVNVHFYYEDEATTLTVRDFSVYPAGTLAQEAELVSFNANKTGFEPGEKIKIDALFANTGEVPVKGVLITEVYRNDEVIDLVRGSELLVEPRNQATLSEFISLDLPGTYTFSSYVEYGFKRTESFDITVEVSGGLFASSTNALLLLLSFSILILGASLAYRSKKMNK